MKAFKSKDFCKKLKFYYAFDYTEMLKKGPNIQARTENTSYRYTFA